MATSALSIFITGATGFVGGAILEALVRSHPNSRIKALVRRETDAKELQSVCSNLEPIIGELSLLSLLTATAASVDLAIHAAHENIPAVQAMIDGLALSSLAERSLPRLISLTGPRSLIDLSVPVTGMSSANDRPWSDLTDAQTILSLPEERIHAESDQAIISHSIANGVGSILLSPGQLWGRSKGHMKKEASSAMYYAVVKSRGRAFVIGDGSATWSWVSINDLADAVVFLIEKATSSGSAAAEQVGVNDQGYYFVQCQDLSMMERAEAVSKRLGLGEVESISVETAAEIHPFGPIMWGCGATFRADKLSQLGWRPKETNWRALMEERGGERA